jgi:exodeoxyribonuclease-3
MEDFLRTGWIDTYRHFYPNVKTISWWNLRRYGQRAIAEEKGKRLDYFLVNTDFLDAVIWSKVMNHITGRDHCPIQMKIDLSSIKPLESKKLTGKQLMSGYHEKQT